MRGLARQRAIRGAEGDLRRENLRLLEALQRDGLSLAAAAHVLGIPRRTLADWRLRQERDGLEARPLGRPASRAPRTTRNLALALLDLFGPHVGLPVLQALVDELVPADERTSRRELRDLLARYRELYRRRNGRPLRVLRWSRPGVVWAVDFTQPDLPVEGRYSYVLAVRDPRQRSSSPPSPAWRRTPRRPAASWSV